MKTKLIPAWGYFIQLYPMICIWKYSEIVFFAIFIFGNRNDKAGDRSYGRDRSERRSDRGGDYSRRDDRDRGNS